MLLLSSSSSILVCHWPVGSHGAFQPISVPFIFLPVLECGNGLFLDLFLGSALLFGLPQAVELFWLTQPMVYYYYSGCSPIFVWVSSFSVTSLIALHSWLLYREEAICLGLSSMYTYLKKRKIKKGIKNTPFPSSMFMLISPTPSHPHRALI